MIFVLGLIRWISYTKEFILKIEEMSMKDFMLDMYNRKGIDKLFHNEVLEGKDFYIIMCDLDGLKTVNDKYGHLEGDRYIKKSTEVIKKVVGIHGNVGRLGGDEFIILLKINQIELLEQIILEIKEKVQKIYIDEKTGISIGYSKFPCDGKTLDNLLIVADKKMYLDKRYCVPI